MAKAKPNTSEAESATPKRFTTLSGLPVKRFYRPADLTDFDPADDLGEPGQFPYTRGIHANMYRGKLWTMRQFFRVCDAGRDEPTLQVSARSRPDRPICRLRLADFDGLRC